MIGFLLNLVLSLGLLYCATTRYVAVKPGVCASCGYDISGLGKRGVCPECGIAFEPGHFAEVDLLLRRRTPGVLWFTLPVAIVWGLLGLTGYSPLSPT